MLDQEAAELLTVLSVLPDLETITRAGRLDDLQTDFRLIRQELRGRGPDGKWLGPDGMNLAMGLAEAIPSELCQDRALVRAITEDYAARPVRQAMLVAIKALADEIRQSAGGLASIEAKGKPEGRRTPPVYSFSASRARA